MVAYPAPIENAAIERAGMIRELVAQIERPSPPLPRGAPERRTWLFRRPQLIDFCNQFDQTTSYRREVSAAVKG